MWRDAGGDARGQEMMLQPELRKKSKRGQSPEPAADDHIICTHAQETKGTHRGPLFCFPQFTRLCGGSDSAHKLQMKKGLTWLSRMQASPPRRRRQSAKYQPANPADRRRWPRKSIRQTSPASLTGIALCLAGVAGLQLTRSVALFAFGGDCAWIGCHRYAFWLR